MCVHTYLIISCIQIFGLFLTNININDRDIIKILPTAVNTTVEEVRLLFAYMLVCQGFYYVKKL